jgi:hypothetical protein
MIGRILPSGESRRAVETVPGMRANEFAPGMRANEFAPKGYATKSTGVD